MSALFHQNLLAEYVYIILGENSELLDLKVVSETYNQYHIGICIPLRVFIVLFSFLLIDTNELETILRELKYRIGIQSAKLLRQLKQKDRLVHKVQRNCDVVTACLQAVSQKRSKCGAGLAR